MARKSTCYRVEKFYVLLCITVSALEIATLAQILKRTNPIELAFRFWTSSNLAMQVSAKITYIKMCTFFKKKKLGIKLWMLTECDVQLFKHILYVSKSCIWNKHKACTLFKNYGIM